MLFHQDLTQVLNYIPNNYFLIGSTLIGQDFLFIIFFWNLLFNRCLIDLVCTTLILCHSSFLTLRCVASSHALQKSIALAHHLSDNSYSHKSNVKLAWQDLFLKITRRETFITLTSYFFKRNVHTSQLFSFWRNTMIITVKNFEDGLDIFLKCILFSNGVSREEMGSLDSWHVWD